MMHVYTYSLGQSAPRFLSLQYAALKKHLFPQWEMTVFDTSESHDEINAIATRCAELGIRHIVADKGRTKGSHPSALIQSWHDFALKERPDLLFIMDFDLCPTTHFDAAEQVRNHGVYGAPQGRTGDQGQELIYLWPGLMLWNMSSPDLQDVNFDGGLIHGASCDVGGRTYHWINAHPGMYRKTTRHANMIHRGDEMLLPQQFQEEYASRYTSDDHEFGFCFLDSFLHYGAGSNWNHRATEIHTLKMDMYERIIRSCI